MGSSSPRTVRAACHCTQLTSADDSQAKQLCFAIAAELQPLSWLADRALLAPEQPPLILAIRHPFGGYLCVGSDTDSEHDSSPTVHGQCADPSKAAAQWAAERVTDTPKASEEPGSLRIRLRNRQSRQWLAASEEEESRVCCEGECSGLSVWSVVSAGQDSAHSAQLRSTGAHSARFLTVSAEERSVLLTRDDSEDGNDNNDDDNHSPRGHAAFARDFFFLRCDTQ